MANMPRPNNIIPVPNSFNLLPSKIPNISSTFKVIPIIPNMMATPTAPLIAGPINKEIKANDPAKTKRAKPTFLSCANAFNFFLSNILATNITAPIVAKRAIAIRGDAIAVIIKSGIASAIYPANANIDLPTAPSFDKAPAMPSIALAFFSPSGPNLLSASTI